MPKRAASLLAMAALLALSACGNLDEIAKVHSVAVDARHALPLVSADLYGSCQRRAAIFARIPQDQLPAEQRAPDCAPFLALADNIAADQAVLVNYLDALAWLASTGNMTYGKSIDTDVTAIGNLTPASTRDAALLDDAQKAGAAALAITQQLANIVTRRYRERELRRIILSADPAIQQLTAALRRVSVTDYGLMLSSEKAFLDSYYLGPMSAPSATTQEPLALILVQRQYDGDVAQLDHRRRAAAAYGRLMQRIATLHGKLADAARDPASFAGSVQHLAPQFDAAADAANALLLEVR